MNRREALEGANYVITTVHVGGLNAIQSDREISEKYGVDESIGDTIGPDGVFLGLRHIPVILDICRDMKELCPDAWLLNHSNPMAIISWAVNEYTHIKYAGLCHSVQHTSSELAKYIGAPYEEISYWVAGINHMAWFLELKWSGNDAYPLLRERFKDPDIYSGPEAYWAGPDVVRAEIFKAFGYFVTESSMHMSEYVPYFKKKNRPELIDRFKIRRFFNYELMLRTKKEQNEALKRQVGGDYKFPIAHSGEYCSTIIRSMETGIPLRINANVMNQGLITNLPEGCCVEVPCLVDKEGIHPCYVGDLPPQLAALNRTNINVQELAVRGIVEKDKTKIFHSILLDPLTGAILTIDETRQLVDEMFKAEKQYVKGYK
jgi:alpha-galactosidase